MAIIKIRELIGTSEKSFEDALKKIVDHQVKAGKNVTGAKVLNQSVEVSGGDIVAYKVNVRVAYKWEE
jgi:flavin-binding protein dodecin